jgi:hypothetical protein
VDWADLRLGKAYSLSFPGDAHINITTLLSIAGATTDHEASSMKASTHLRYFVSVVPSAVAVISVPKLN